VVPLLQKAEPAAAAAASCASCSVQCCPVSSCTAATVPGTSAAERDKLTKTVGAQRGPRGGICAPCLSSPHSSACDKWDVYGQWNACPVLLVLHRKASGRTFSRTQTSCCTCCPEQPSVQPPHLQSSRWALTAASPSPHASATTRLAGFGCCSAVCLTSGHDPFWRNLCGHPSQVCSQCRTTSATCQSLSSHSVERIHGSERRGGLS
jgi:hypothetical protein